MTAAASTVEALVYACRQGPQALERPDNVRRVRELNEEQLQELHGRVQRFGDLQYEGNPVMRWSVEQADALLDEWNRISG
jgi:hypothetical protein